MDKPRLPMERLERRLNLLRLLACSLEEAQQAIVHSDLLRLEQQTLTQAKLCNDLEKLESAGSSASPEQCDSTHQPYVMIECQTREIEGRVRHLARVHAALLRGAQDSLAVLAHLLFPLQGTYEPSDPIERSLCGHKEKIQCRI